jgi:transposase
VDLNLADDRPTGARSAVVIDADGKRRLSRRVANDETELLKLIADVLELSDGEPVTWAIDLNAGGAALMIALRVGDVLDPWDRRSRSALKGMSWPRTPKRA